MAVLFDIARKVRSTIKNARDNSNSQPRQRVPNNVLPDIIGLPPGYGESLSVVTGNENAPNMNDVIQDTFPILEIIPCEQQVVASPEMFRLIPALLQGSKNGLSYADELSKYYDFELSPSTKESKKLKYAIMGNSFPVMESFSNEVGESVFQSIFDTGSRVLRDFSFMGGVQNIDQAIGKVGGAVDSLLGTTNKEGKGGTAENAARAGRAKLQQWESALSNKIGVDLRGTTDIIGETIMGKAIDFPQLWRSSSWCPSYNANIRLYNPYPGDKDATNRFIVGPLASLLMFVCPRTSNGYNFSWPWMCKYRVPGLFNVQAGFIKDVTVIRGGDDNHFALNGMPGIVDVRITLGTLYSNMLAGNSAKLEGRGNPKLYEWLGQMGLIYESDNINLGPKKWSNGQPGFSEKALQEFPGAVQGPDWKQTGYATGFLDSVENILSQAAAIASVVPGVTQQTNEILNNRNEVPNRVSDYAKNQYSALKGLGG